MIERTLSAWHVMERLRAWGDLLDEDALGVRGAAVWGVVGKAAVAKFLTESLQLGATL